MAPVINAALIPAGLLAVLGGCAMAGAEDAADRAFAPVYGPADVIRLDTALVAFNVTMQGARSGADVTAYARCLAAGYTVQRGYGFARHVRTNLDEEGGVWRADAVYTVSPALPRGSQTIDAEVAVADCAEQGIPTV